METSYSFLMEPHLCDSVACESGHMSQRNYPVILNCYNEVKAPSVTADIVYVMNKAARKLFY